MRPQCSYAGSVGRLLVIEDDETIGSLLQAGLRSHGHEVAWARGGRSALREATLADFDLVLLDLGLPDVDGVEVCRQLRDRQPGCVLVMLTARRDEMDVVVGLEAGADDYLTKPFRLAELRARVAAHLRRGPTRADRHNAVRTVGALVVDTAARRCQLGGTEVALRAKEFDLLARLAADPGVALSRETLMSDVWDEHWSGSTKTLDVHIAALRRRLDDAATQGNVVSTRITTVRGHGYRLEKDS
jgi:DNA-binding response OmpR family regulator